MRKNVRIETIKKVHKIRRNSECIFKDVICECKSNGKLQTEKNHIISKSCYLKKISNQKRVMVFDYEQKDYYENGGLLVERNISKANVYRVFCGNHDKLLFNEIENEKIFDKFNNKQCFQFAFRSFIFKYSQCLVKRNFKLVHPFFEIVAESHYELETKSFERFKKDYQSENWEDIESKVIILKRKIEFVSCFYARPIWGIDKEVIISRDKIAFNIFPSGEETIILMSYLKGSSKAISNYCEKLYKYTDKEKLMKYLNKIIITYDSDIAINPLLWNRFSKSEKRSFYEFAHLFKKNNRGLIRIIKKTISLNFKYCKCNLFLELTQTR
ncbi:hypothetical protein DWC20_08795 [Clostridium botulinum]|nr:hypothetical protein [Clostridium botulinum]MBN1035641.1 hypothetical protein [Clostridium botulinum]NFO12244.1 hypothetical protein [Clostridium botulinum]